MNVAAAGLVRLQSFLADKLVSKVALFFVGFVTRIVERITKILPPQPG
jgi:hypothetical protein